MKRRCTKLCWGESWDEAIVDRGGGFGGRDSAVGLMATHEHTLAGREKDAMRRDCIDFLLRENYFLTAFELLQELQEDGLADYATKLQLFFADANVFPPEEIDKIKALQGSLWRRRCIVVAIDVLDFVCLLSRGERFLASLFLDCLQNS